MGLVGWILYTYDVSGERVVRYVPGRLDAFYNASNTGFSDRLESFVYPSGLLTAKTLKGMNINKQIMTYTKHYYIGAERISSVIGTGNSVGYNICISDFPSSSDLTEMNQKVTQAAQALQNDYDYFEKHLSLSQPFSTRPSCGISSTGTETPYDANKEIDAYRTELGVMGEINFEPYRDYNSFENLKKIGQKDSLINCEDITNNFLQRVVDNPGINQEKIYGTPQDNPNFYEN